MRFRRFVFLTCIFLLSVLFIDGISVLVVIARKNESRQEAKYETRQKIRFETDDEPREKTGIGTEDIMEQEESSIASSEPVNLLILGLDQEGKRSDVIMLVNYSPDVGRVNLLSIARDTRVRAKGRYRKINSLIGIGGEKLIIGKVEELTGLNIDYYVSLDFEGFRKIIDALGGVEIDVPMDMDYDDPEQNLHIHLKKGKQILNGKKAEQFARYRKGNRKGEGYQDGDIDRMKAQQMLIKALLEQKLKLRYFNKIDDIFYILKDHMRTNIEMRDISYYLPKVKKIKYKETKSFTIPGESEYGGLWYFIYDKKKLQEIIDKNFFK